MELDLRGIEPATIRAYLAGLGGVSNDADVVTGQGWQVTLEVGRYLFSKWELPRVILRFSGEPAVVEGVVRRLRLLTMRGGG